MFLNQMSLPLNEVVKNDENWYCNVFEFDKLNIGNVCILWDEFDEEKIESKNVFIRVYRKTKKIVVSGTGSVNDFCVLDFRYHKWKCFVCKKISDISMISCFCGESKCWSPIDPTIVGVVFLSNMQYSYHFDNALGNLIYE